MISVCVSKYSGDDIIKAKLTWVGLPDFYNDKVEAHLLFNRVCLYLLTGDSKYKEQAEKVTKQIFKDDLEINVGEFRDSISNKDVRYFVPQFSYIPNMFGQLSLNMDVVFATPDKSLGSNFDENLDCITNKELFHCMLEYENTVGGYVSELTIKIIKDGINKLIKGSNSVEAFDGYDIDLFYNRMSEKREQKICKFFRGLDLNSGDL